MGSFSKRWNVDPLSTFVGEAAQKGNDRFSLFSGELETELHVGYLADHIKMRISIAIADVIIKYGAFEYTNLSKRVVCMILYGI